ncbi:MAG: hypothetical protein JSS32_00700 [Verrucomicrobia bacterium]|nr:hypothetical protein [Verrucomicrobiota bacterium]
MLSHLILGFVALVGAAQKAPEAEQPTAPRHVNLTGAGSFGSEFIDSISGAGLVKLNGTQVENLKIDGSLISKDAKLGSISVQGEVNLRDSVVSGKTHVIGYVTSQGSSFQNLTISTPKATFTKTRIDSLTVQSVPSYKGKQVLELKQGTIVSGPITFESGKGEVLVDSTSRIEGKVSGGKVIHKNGK